MLYACYVHTRYLLAMLHDLGVCGRRRIYVGSSWGTRWFRCVHAEGFRIRPLPPPPPNGWVAAILCLPRPVDVPDAVGRARHMWGGWGVRGRAEAGEEEVEAGKEEEQD